MGVGEVLVEIYGVSSCPRALLDLPGEIFNQISVGTHGVATKGPGQRRRRRG